MRPTAVISTSIYKYTLSITNRVCKKQVKKIISVIFNKSLDFSKILEVRTFSTVSFTNGSRF